MMPDSAVLQLQRLVDVAGYPNLVVQAADGEVVRQEECGDEVDGHPAVVQRMRLTGVDRFCCAASVGVVPAERQFLGGFVIAPTDAGREALLAVLLDMEIHRR